MYVCSCAHAPVCVNVTPVQRDCVDKCMCTGEQKCVASQWHNGEAGRGCTLCNSAGTHTFVRLNVCMCNISRSVRACIMWVIRCGLVGGRGWALSYELFSLTHTMHSHEYAYLCAYRHAHKLQLQCRRMSPFRTHSCTEKIFPFHPKPCIINAAVHSLLQHSSSPLPPYRSARIGQV